ncbi:MAG: response regulator [Lachnospiraceae bacterium]|nr:response regulator [Lachnospiraceae bacterium]
MVFKALVADDEYMIRRGIIRFLKKYEDFEVVAEAEDGEVALELAKKHSIDVYFVDINMPFLNGLQFIEKIKEIHPKALVVIITGYDSFDYARTALRMGVFEYLLKPIMEDKFQEMIEAVREELIREKNENKYLEWAKNTLLQNRGYLASSFLQKVLEGHFTAEEMRERFNYLGVEIPEDFVVTVVRLEHQTAIDMKEEWTDDLLFFVAENVANEIFNQMDSLRSCQNDTGDLIVLSRQVEGQEEQLQQYCDLLKSQVSVKCIAVQKAGTGIGNLVDAYQEAMAQIEEEVGISSVIQEVKDYVEQNYWRVDFSLPEAANYVNLSVPYMSKLFRKEAGMTFVDYLTSVRIRKSIDLFRNEKLKIYEIAEHVGYTTQHYFSTVFKKNLGVSPAEYRKKMKEK